MPGLQEHSTTDQGLKSQKFLIALEARIPKIKVLAGLVFSEAVLLCLQRATFSLGPCRVLPLCLSHVIRILVRLDYGPVL